MHGKILLGIALASLATTSIAMEITHGKLLSHKEWVTGKGVGSFSAVEPAKSRLHKSHPRLHNDPSDNEGVVVNTRTFERHGKVNSPVLLDAASHILIMNRTQSVQTYTISGMLCSGRDDTPYVCNHFEDVISLDPNGNVVSNRWPTLSVNYEKMGHYYITTENSVGRGSFFFESYDDADLEISN